MGEIECPTLRGSTAPTRDVTQAENLSYSEVDAFGLDPTNTYAYFDIRCTYGVNTSLARYIVRTRTGRGMQSVFEGAVYSAMAQAQLPEVGFSPPDAGIVNLPTWYWVENWDPVSGSDADGYITIVVTGEPMSTTFVTGNDDDGESVTCDGPGERWDPDAGVDPMSASSCSYTYTYPSSWDRSGVFEVEATTTWSFRWSLNGVDQGAIGEVGRVSVIEYRVDEIHTVGGAP